MSALAVDVQQRGATNRHQARRKALRAQRHQAALDAACRTQVQDLVATFRHDLGGSLPTPPKPHRNLYGQCLAGREPAEALPAKERELLVAELCSAGWTDQQIAQHCRQTLYTTARIRARLGLSPNSGQGEVKA